ncbi:PEP/pyruvate-binding domain-containing protein [Deinococcus arcticus]|uniref:Phosphoenolpyruvate synthase n=1 Tax=Deinococcus arcticus TaxID=2136176 RepID=A0A2T3W633_9DEIO|nr:PEP/pyruvate-binding domain-containing protein [Deinococcus arcticus]PTA67223.1 hypothetical protein C8263_14105 [Deinococcus arcticus]
MAAVHQTGPHQTGAKAWRLTQLRRYGFPVPDLYVVPAWVHADWLQRSRLEPRLRSAAPNELERLRTQLHGTPLPGTLIAALAELAPVAPAWAVRSSAPHEDGSAASFAGQYATCLNVSGLQALCEAVRQVWASMWTPAALSYRVRHGAAADFGMAVLLMPMVPAVSSGVAFTRDPLTGQPERIIIQANWGLGESLVQGLSAGDESTVHTHPLNADLTGLQTTVGRKTQQVQLQPEGGTRTEAVPIHQQRQPVLQPAQALHLAGLLRQAALSLNFAAPHFDLEWAFDGHRFWLLQARPLTAVNGRGAGQVQGQPTLWSRGNTGEVMPFPLSAIDWSAAQNIGEHVLKSSLLAAGYAPESAVPRLALHQGHLYMNMTLVQWELKEAFGLSPADTNALLGGQQRALTWPQVTWTARLRQGKRLLKLAFLTPALRRKGRRQATRLLRWSAREARRPLPTSSRQQAAALDRLFTHLNRQQALFFLQGGSGASAWALRRLLTRLMPLEGPALALDLLTGGAPSVSAAQAHDLARLASLLRTDGLTRTWVEHTAAGQLAPGLPRRHPFRRAFEEYLRRYGHRATYESYTRHARWREDPSPLLHHLCSLAAQAPVSAGPAGSVSAHLRRLPGGLQVLRPAIGLLARLAQQELRDRELGRSAVFSPVEPYRRLLLHIGRSWATSGHIEQPSDVFDLTLPEIHALLRQERPFGGLRDLVLDRQQATEAWRALSVPDVYTRGALVPTSADSPPVQAPRAAGRHTLTGTGASSGVVTGRACVMDHPNDLGTLQAGDILVVRSADPSWTPVFLQARGLVMETGGLLSHGTIVAREFSLPTVLNIPGIRQQVRTGDLLHVDGAAGTVTVYSREDHP